MIFAFTTSGPDSWRPAVLKSLSYERWRTYDLRRGGLAALLRCAVARGRDN